MQIELLFSTTRPWDQQLKNFQARLKTLAMQRCKLSHLIIPTVADVQALSRYPGVYRLYSVTREHSVLYQSDGVQRPPSFGTDISKAQHRLNSIG